MNYREQFSLAIQDILEDKSVLKLSRLTGIPRHAIHKLVKMERPFVKIDHLYILMEHGLEINSTLLFMERLKREGKQVLPKDF